MNGKFSGTNYFGDVTTNSTIFDSWIEYDNEVSLYNFGGYKIVIINLSFRTSSALKAHHYYDLFTLPSIVRPSGYKVLLLRTHTALTSPVTHFTFIKNSGVITYHCNSSVSASSSCDVFGVYSINF